MLTGDNAATARRIADELGVRSVIAPPHAVPRRPIADVSEGSQSESSPGPLTSRALLVTLSTGVEGGSSDSLGGGKEEESPQAIPSPRAAPRQALR